jgi:hypothetical protein
MAMDKLSISVLPSAKRSSASAGRASFSDHFQVLVLKSNRPAQYGDAFMKPHDNAAMSFDEIGRRLGITGGGASMLYRSALRKLRRKRKMRELAQLVAAKDYAEIDLRVDERQR